MYRKLRKYKILHDFSDSQTNEVNQLIVGIKTTFKLNLSLNNIFIC